MEKFKSIFLYKAENHIQQLTNKKKPEKHVKIFKIRKNLKELEILDISAGITGFLLEKVINKADPKYALKALRWTTDAAGYAITGAQTYYNITLWKNEQISDARFGYRMVGLGAEEFAGRRYGNLAGFATGVVVIGIEDSYDLINNTIDVLTAGIGQINSLQWIPLYGNTR